MASIRTRYAHGIYVRVYDGNNAVIYAQTYYYSSHAEYSHAVSQFADPAHWHGKDGTRHAVRVELGLLMPAAPPVRNGHHALPSSSSGSRTAIGH